MCTCTEILYTCVHVCTEILYTDVFTEYRDPCTGCCSYEYHYVNLITKPTIGLFLNLVVTDSIRSDIELSRLQSKCREIVKYFKQSNVANNKLSA